MFHSKLKNISFFHSWNQKSSKAFFTMYVTSRSITYVTEGKLGKRKKKFALTFRGEFIRQPINKFIKKKSAILTNHQTTINKISMIPFMFGFQHRVLPVPLVKSGCRSLNWREPEVKFSLTQKDYRYGKLLKIYFILLLNGCPDTLNHYAMGKHTDFWKPPLEDSYQQAGVCQGTCFPLKHLLLLVLQINSDGSIYQ